MVCVYGFDISRLPDPSVEPIYMEGLPEERKQKIRKYKQSQSRRQSLGAGLLLKKVLQMHGISDAKMETGKHGKPETEGICFNLSHSENMVVCVVGTEAVGCDVEKIAQAQMRIAEHFFCESEKQHLEQVRQEERNREFYRLWTMKESYIKMTGEGLSIPFDVFEILFDDRIKIKRDEKICPCYMKEYEMPGYCLTVCSEEKEFAEQVEYITLEC